MREGLLWYDNDPKKALTIKVAEAAQAYQRKFGQRPDTCYVAPETIAGDTHGMSLRLVPSTLVRPHHFWVGMDARAASMDERSTSADRPTPRRARPRPQPAALAS